MPFFLPSPSISTQAFDQFMDFPTQQDIRMILGPIVVGVMLNAFLYALVFLQLIHYCMSTNGDRLMMKLLISWEMLVDTFQSALSVYTLWLYAVDNFMHRPFLLIGIEKDVAPWPLSVNSATRVFSTCPVQVYLSYHVYKLSGSRKLFMVLLTLSLLHASLSVATTAITFLRVDLGIITVVISFLALFLLSNLAINGCLVFYLKKSRNSLPRTDHIVSHLIRQAIETASFPSLFSIILVISLICWPLTAVNCIFSIPLGRVYSNTFLAILNSRQSFQTVLDVEDFSSNQAIPGVSNKQPDSSTFTQASNAAAITHFEPSTMTSGTTAGHTGTSIITEPDRSRSSMALTEIESLQFSAYSDSVYNGSVIGRNSGSMDINIIN